MRSGRSKAPEIVACSVIAAAAAGGENRREAIALVAEGSAAVRALNNTALLG